MRLMASERQAAVLPSQVAGQWDTPDGHEIASEYLGRDRSDLAMGEMSDLLLANTVFMADRFDLGLLAYQTAAKERIRWLSAQLALARVELAQLRAEQVSA
jgi:hypothetical protein